MIAIKNTLPVPTKLPDISPEDTTGTGHDFGWIVTVFNNNYNTWDEVIYILQKATGCSMDEAYIETWEIDNLGQSVVHHGSEKECEKVASIIATIGIRVEVSQP